LKYLITGVAGFLGSALANKLSAEGHEVVGIDDLSTGDPNKLAEEVKFTHADVNDRPKLWTLLKEVDCVYHLAARVSVQESMRYPREYNAVNVGGTVSVLEAMRDVGVRRLVFVSSGAIYGDQAEQPMHEAMVPHPRSPYAVSKLAAEQYIHTIGQLWEIEAVSLRVFNAYGPGQQLPVTHPPVIPHFIQQTLGRGSLVVHGDGTQTRDFVYIDDVVDALLAAATRPGINRRVINVGSGVETTMNDMIAEIARSTAQQPHVLHVSGQSGGVSRMGADLTLARELLGYEPKFLLAEGLRRMIAEDERFAVKLGAQNVKKTGPLAEQPLLDH